MHNPSTAIDEVIQRYKSARLFRKFDEIIRVLYGQMSSLGAFVLKHALETWNGTQEPKDRFSGRILEWPAPFDRDMFYLLKRPSPEGQNIDLCCGHIQKGMWALLTFNDESGQGTWVYYNKDLVASFQENVFHLVAENYHEHHCNDLQILSYCDGWKGRGDQQSAFEQNFQQLGLLGVAFKAVLKEPGAPMHSRPFGKSKKTKGLLP